MKKTVTIVFALFMMISAKTFAQQAVPDHEGSLVKWISLKEALEKNEKEAKPIILDFYTDWCGWCKHMMKTTYADPNLAAYINQYFYAAKFDAEGKDTIEYLGTKYYPTSAAPRTAHPLAVKLLQGRLSYPTTLFLNGYNKEKKEFSLNMLAAGYLEVKKFEPLLIFSLENVFRNSNYDDFRAAFETAFYDSTNEVKTKKLNWLQPKNYFTAAPKTDKKKTIVILNTDWCNGCKVMKRTSFTTDTLLSYVNKKFNLVDFNPDVTDSLMYNGKIYVNPKTQSTPFHQLAFEITRGTIGFPTMVLLDEENKVIDIIPYYLTSTSVDDVLHYYGEDLNKVKPWQDFVKERHK